MAALKWDDVAAHRAALAKVEGLNLLTPREIIALAKAGVLMSMTAGEKLFDKGSKATHVMALFSGQLMFDGGDDPVATLTGDPGLLWGEVGLLQLGSTRYASASAGEEGAQGMLIPYTAFTYGMLQKLTPYLQERQATYNFFTEGETK